MFDVLTYEKGASVLRMLEQHIGPTVFRDGVRDYLHAHAYGNADTKRSLGFAGEDRRNSRCLNSWTAGFSNQGIR